MRACSLSGFGYHRETSDLPVMRTIFLSDMFNSCKRRSSAELRLMGYNEFSMDLLPKPTK